MVNKDADRAVNLIKEWLEFKWSLEEKDIRDIKDNEVKLTIGYFIAIFPEIEGKWLDNENFNYDTEVDGIHFYAHGWILDRMSRDRIAYLEKQRVEKYQKTPKEVRLNWLNDVMNEVNKYNRLKKELGELGIDVKDIRRDYVFIEPKSFQRLFPDVKPDVRTTYYGNIEKIFEYVYKDIEFVAYEYPFGR